MNASNPKPRIIGTRGSELALVQAAATQAALTATFPHLTFQQKIIKTTGDRRTDVSLAHVAKAEGTFDKGIFIKEIEEALDSGEIDIAVHSLKDLPTTLGPRYRLAATLQRAPIRDVLISLQPGGIHSLPHAAHLGTSSVRRAEQLKWLRPDLLISDLRGNVPTRLRKLAEETHHHAILLAEAGLIRLGYIPEIPPPHQPELIHGFPTLHLTRLHPHQFFPAAGQGAVALEVRSTDSANLALAQAINHPETWLQITAEREFLRLLDGGCHTPVGIYSTLHHSTITLHARVFPDHGGHPRTATASGTDPHTTALQLFHSLP